MARKYEVHELSESEARGKGYDIESKMPGGIRKYIEVKGSSEVRPKISITANQHQRMVQESERTFVYIVINALKDPELYIIPGKRLLEGLAFELKFSPSQWLEKVEDHWRLRRPHGN